MNIPGSIALVTGASRGLGAALVHALVGAGASRVYAAMRRPPAVADGGPVVPIALDVTDPDQVRWAAAELGDVQLVINNAGVNTARSLLAADAEDAAAEDMRVNYFGTLRVARAFAPILGRNGGGALVNVLSILARVSLPQVGSYAASKAAALSLTRSLRGELAAQGTLVVGVLPGFIDTDMARRVPLPKLRPGEVAAQVVEALRAGTEDVYPGEAADIAQALTRDPKAVERRFATLLAAPAGAR